MIEDKGKRDGHGEQNNKCRSIAERGQEQQREVDYEDEDFGGGDIRHDRADKKSFFAFEDGATGITTMLQTKRSSNDRRIPADRTSELQRASQSCCNRARISLHFELQAA